MSDNTVILNTLLQQIQFANPRLYDLLRVMINDINKINNEVFPPPTELPVELPGISEEFPPDITFFAYELHPTFINLFWQNPNPLEIFSYEIRKGTDWDTANRILITNSFSAQVEPQLIGTHRYLIKAINVFGIYSTNAAFVDVVIPALGSLVVTSRVIDNNVLLFWTVPTSVFQIRLYEVFRFGSLFGTAFATFKTIFEQSAGTFTYGVRAVDIAGNVSPTIEIVINVATPPDYVLRDQRTSDLLGERDYVGRIHLHPELVFNVDEYETWEEHFIRNGWNTPEEQINAGYPIYCQPTPLVGNYQEIVDYDLVISNILVNIDYVIETIFGDGHNFVFTLEASTTGPTTGYGTPILGTSAFFTSIRWLRITIEGTAIN